MPEEVNDAGQQRDVASANFEALESDVMFSNNVIEKNPITEEKKEEVTENVNTETKEEPATETKEEVVEGEDPENKKEEDPENKEEVTELIEFKAEDIPGFEKEPEDGTWIAVAKAKGLDITEDSFEAYSEAFDAKLKAVEESAKSITLDTILSSVKPETAAIIKLMEMGVSEESILAPTANIDNFLSMEDAQLIREDLKLQGWDDDRIDTELEIQAEKGWLKHNADTIRLALNTSKKEIIEQREAILNQYTQNKEKAVLEQRQKEVVQFKEALNTVSSFMNVNISAEAKEAIIAKFNRGDYDQQLNDPKSKVELILFKDLGQKALKHIENTAFQKGREDKTKALLNIPPVKGNVAKAAKDNNQIQSPFEAFNDFK